jgi:hypothetical protein
MGFASNVPSASQTTTRVTDCSYAGKAFRGEPITNELLLEARRDMDLTAAFEELLKREKAGRISISPEYPLLSAFTREQLHKVRSKGLPQLWPNQGRVASSAPQHPMQLIVPTLHILLGIINDIVSRYGAFMAEHLEVDTEGAKAS